MTIILIVSIIGLTFVQVTIFNSMPKYLKGLLSCVPLLAIMINFMISGVVLMFTGIGMYAGIANLIGSVILGFYIIGYKSVYGITVNVEWRGKWIFKIPILSVKETKSPEGALKIIY